MTPKGKQFGREYPTFSLKRTRFAKSLNHPGGFVEKLDTQDGGKALEKINRGVLEATQRREASRDP